MPWCPNCKTEYRKGFTICSDCNTPLVEKLVDDEMVPFFQAEEKIIAERLVSYFDYSGLPSDIQYHEENQVYVVSIPAEKQMEAKKLYQAFYFVEREMAGKESSQKEAVSKDNHTSGSDWINDISDDSNHRPYASASCTAETVQANEDSKLLQDDTAVTEDSTSKDALEVEGMDAPPENNEPTTYVMKSEQYKDLKSTVWIFLFFGIAGLLILALNLVGIFNFVHGFIPYIVMGALFLFFLYVALSTNRKANMVQAEIEEENKLTDKINKWLKANITKDYLAAIHKESVSSELNYLKATQHIHDLLIKEFGPQNSAYLDRLIEDYYSNYLE